MVCGALPAERLITVPARGWATLVAFVGGQSAREIGADLGLSHDAAWAMVHRTGRLLEEELARDRRRWGGRLPSAAAGG